jgi:hypothetical protein
MDRDHNKGQPGRNESHDSVHLVPIRRDHQQPGGGHLASTNQWTLGLLVELNTEIEETQLDLQAMRPSVRLSTPNLHEELNLRISGTQVGYKEWGHS